ncbi:MAG: NADH dehydrogenase subunit E, partial [Pararhizobium sp.]
PEKKPPVPRAKKVSDEAAVSVPPSNAARVKTAAPETDPTLKTPAATKPEAAAKPSLEDKNRPGGIEKPATPDDLKLISGVGPKIEATLHELGIFSYAQVAGWKKAERDWVDGYLNFKGRVDRDDWVKQAKALAKGGEAEYIKVFGKKPR